MGLGGKATRKLRDASDANVRLPLRTLSGSDANCAESQRLRRENHNKVPPGQHLSIDVEGALESLTHAANSEAEAVLDRGKWQERGSRTYGGFAEQLKWRLDGGRPAVPGFALHKVSPLIMFANLHSPCSFDPHEDTELPCGHAQRF